MGSRILLCGISRIKTDNFIPIATFHNNVTDVIQKMVGTYVGDTKTHSHRVPTVLENHGKPCKMKK